MAAPETAVSSPGSIGPGFFFADGQKIQAHRTDQLFAGGMGKAVTCSPGVEPGEITKDANLTVIRRGHDDAEPVGAGGHAPQDQLFLIVERYGGRIGAVGDELRQPGFVGKMFGLEDAAILLVQDVGPVEFIDDDLAGTAVCHRVQDIFYDEGATSAGCALVGGAVEIRPSCS